MTPTNYLQLAVFLTLTVMWIKIEFINRKN